MSGFAVIRADATPSLGTGHIARCLRFADALGVQGWRCAFAVSAETPETAPRLSDSGYEVFIIDACDEPAAIARHWPDGCDLLLVDHYEREAPFESACRAWAGRIGVIEDLAQRSHDCDFMIDPGVINSNSVRREDLLYLGGPAFAALHPAFREARLNAARRRTDGEVRRIMISFGGGDVDILTASVATSIAEALPDCAIDAVLGIAGPDRSESLSRLKGIGDRISIYSGCGPDRMAAMMARADVGVGAAGGTSWERCCLGLPSVAALIADNQKGNADLLAATGAAKIVDLTGLSSDNVDAVSGGVEKLASDAEGRMDMAAAAARICDGLGAERLAAIVDTDAVTPDGRRIWMRPAIAGDIETVYDWQCEPGARTWSHNPEPPGPAVHRHWMEARLDDPACIFSIVMCGDAPVGTIRLDRRKNGYLVSILTGRAFHRMGIGSAALAMARRLVPESDLIAEILPGNAASVGLFAKAGYRQQDEITYVSRATSCRPVREDVPA